MPRQARLDAPGTLHHVIIRGIEKRSIVLSDTDRKDFVSRMGDLAYETKTPIYAWALMSNHAHILLHSGQAGLPGFMRRLLTGYAVSYNLRHSRHGHLFQNRYKSIVCEEDAYFKELVRYIHLNPVRAGLVKDLEELDRYGWCGHAFLMGHSKNKWQDQDYVLRWFGKRLGGSRRAYRRYVEEGYDQGRLPKLAGGGLIRSIGGWSEVVSLRRLGLKEQSDERILGSGDFVNEMIQEADASMRRRFSHRERAEEIKRYINEHCLEQGVNIQELQSGSRRPEISRLRRKIASNLLEQYGVPLAEIARNVGVTTSAISKAIRRRSRD
ncbi:MAG: transposase [Thermodesulfobacteriota bacterium]